MSQNKRLAYDGPEIRGSTSGEGVGKARLQLQLTRLAAMLLLLAWTVYWAIRALDAVRFQLSLSDGLYGQGLFAWQIFRVLFTASHLGIPWAAGALPLGVVAGWVQFRLRRG